MSQAAELINSAERPLVLVGQGVELGDKGLLGMHGNLGSNNNTNKCDVLIAVGMRFDDRVTGKLDTYAKQAKIIHFDIDPAEIDKHV